MAASRYRYALLFLGLALLPLAAATIVTLAPRCASAAWLGLPCPGCGVGRSIVALARGDGLVALGSYPPLGLVALGYAWALCATAIRWAGRPWPRGGRWLAPLLTVGLPVLVLGQWVIRLLSQGEVR